MSRSRQVSFVKEVYHSTDEETEGNWVALSHVGNNTPERKDNYIQGEEDINHNELSIPPASWEKMLSTLETKCEIDTSHLQYKIPLHKHHRDSLNEVWKAQLWHIDVAVKKIKLRHEHSSKSNILSPTLAQEVTLLKYFN